MFTKDRKSRMASLFSFLLPSKKSDEDDWQYRYNPDGEKGAGGVGRTFRPEDFAEMEKIDLKHSFSEKQLNGAILALEKADAHLPENEKREIMDVGNGRYRVVEPAKLPKLDQMHLIFSHAPTVTPSAGSPAAVIVNTFKKLSKEVLFKKEEDVLEGIKQLEEDNFKKFNECLKENITNCWDLKQLQEIKKVLLYGQTFASIKKFEEDDDYVASNSTNWGDHEARNTQMWKEAALLIKEQENLLMKMQADGAIGVGKKAEIMENFQKNFSGKIAVQRGFIPDLIRKFRTCPSYKYSSNNKDEINASKEKFKEFLMEKINSCNSLDDLRSVRAVVKNNPKIQFVLSKEYKKELDIKFKNREKILEEKAHRHGNTQLISDELDDNHMSIENKNQVDENNDLVCEDDKNTSKNDLPPPSIPSPFTDDDIKIIDEQTKQQIEMEKLEIHSDKIENLSTINSNEKQNSSRDHSSDKSVVEAGASNNSITNITDQTFFRSSELENDDANKKGDNINKSNQSEQKIEMVKIAAKDLSNQHEEDDNEAPVIVQQKTDDYGQFWEITNSNDKKSKEDDIIHDDGHNSSYPKS